MAQHLMNKSALPDAADQLSASQKAGISNAGKQLPIIWKELQDVFSKLS